MAAIASGLRQPLIPWQRYAADVALEVDSDGLFVYPIVLITVQRQAGKTTLDLSCNIQNALMPSLAPRRVWYTAQTGQHASDKWRDQIDNLWSLSALKGLAGRPRMSNGSQSLKFFNGSEFRPHPPTEDSLHSKQSDKNTVDEAWAFSQLQGDNLLGAITPTTTTRKMATGQRPQLWIMSTEGTVESTWLNGLLERARAGDPSICLMDFGIDKDDDPTDLNRIAARHPGFGHLLDMSTLRDAADTLPPGEFARAYGNRRTGSAERILPEEAWNSARTTVTIPEDTRIGLAAARGVDDVDTSIVAAARVNGRMVVEVIESAAGTHWAVDRIAAIAGRARVPVAVDRYGPSAALYDDLSRAGVEMLDLKTAGVSAACSNVFTGITARPAVWTHRSHPALDAAAELATRKWVSDGAWVWGRRASVGSISALEAATNAAWAADRIPAERALQLG